MTFDELSKLQSPQDPDLFSLPNIILFILLFIQVLKLLRPFLERYEWARVLFGLFDKGTRFVKEFSPLVYDIIEAAQKKGLIEKDSKPVEFLKRLRIEAQMQGIALTPEQEAEAKLRVAGKAAFDHLQNALPILTTFDSEKKS